MSLVPMLFRDWWDDHEISRPSHIHDQHFGTGLNLDDLISSMSLQRNKYFRPWKSSSPLMRQDSGSTICNDRDKFQVILDVQQFAPKEVTVKVCGLSVVVEGRHEEKQDEHGFISRHFVRRYLLPAGHEPEDVVSTLSSDGILTVTAPKRTEKTAKGERVVPITPTGPAKTTVTHADSPQPIIEQPN